MKTFRTKNHMLWIFAVCFLTQNIFSSSLWALPEASKGGKVSTVKEKKFDPRAVKKEERKKGEKEKTVKVKGVESDKLAKASGGDPFAALGGDSAIS